MYQKGDRIEMVHMANDPDPIPRGTQGTVTYVSELNFGRRPETQVGVQWDNGRTLSVILPEDQIRHV